MTDHLIIGDAHTKPGVSNDRFEWLARFVLDTRPDVIIDMGDWADMPSLSSYDVGKKSFEGRRYRLDVEAAKDARRRFNTPIDKYNAQRRKNKDKLYLPRKVALGGNHDDARINRVCELSPQLDGTLSVGDLCTKELGWEAHPFLEVVVIDGIAYSHYFSSGVLNRAISGEHPADALLTKQSMSCTSGHLHLRDFSERTRADGQKILGLMAGCFLAADQHEDYAGNANGMWWKGVVRCKNVVNGYYDPEFVSIEELQKEYA